MPSELLNNCISKMQSAPVSQTAVTQPVLQNINVQNQQNTKANTVIQKTDTFEKSNKKALMGGIAAGTLILGGGFILLAKKSKLGEGCKAFIDKIFKPHDKVVQNAAESAQNISNKTEPAAEKYLPPEICPEKIGDETDEILYRAKVPYESKSIADDLNNWMIYRESLPKMSQTTTGNPINPVFSEFEIKPHNYADDTKIFISARDYTRDFANYEVENGVMKRLKKPIQESTKECSASLMFEMQKNKRCLQTGHFDNGKKYVTFAYTNGETYENGRLGYETVMLVSNGSEFTQAQKDAIRIFKTLDDNLSPTTPLPLYFASATAANAEISKLDSELVKRFNKNTLLSAISSWAENSPKFDVDEYIKKAGDTFRTGLKCARLGNLNQID